MKSTAAQADIGQQIKYIKTALIIDLINVIPSISIAVFSNSLVLLIDVFDNALSITSLIISVVILRRCLKDERGSYDFGFGKMESFSALITSLFMLVGLSLLIVEAFRRVVNPAELNYFYITIGIGYKVILFLVNVYLWFNLRRLDKKTPSPIVEAQWKACRAYAFNNIAVILSLLIGICFTQYDWSHKVDPAFAIVLILITGKSFVDLIRKSLSDLLDRTLDEKIQFMILKRLAEFEDGYERFYDVRSRKSGNRIFVEITLGFDPNRRVGDALKISEIIKKNLESDIDNSEVNIILRSIEEFG